MADKLANVSALRDDLERNGHIDWSRFDEGRAGAGLVPRRDRERRVGMGADC